MNVTTSTTATVNPLHLPISVRRHVRNAYDNELDLLDDDTITDVTNPELGGNGELAALIAAAHAAGATTIGFDPAAARDPHLAVFDLRLDALDTIIDDHTPTDGWEQPTDINRFCLIEQSRYGGYWISTFATPDDAGAYHANQEYAEDWEIVTLTDLDTGIQYQPTVRTVVTFSPT